MYCTHPDARDPQIITLRPDHAANCWTAAAAEWADLFGAPTIPTPYTLHQDSAIVAAEIQRRNPLSRIVIATPDN